MQIHPPSKSVVGAYSEDIKVFTHRSRPVMLSGKKCIQIPHTIENTRILGNMGVQIPSPVEHYYEYPGPYERPYTHQTKTAGFMTIYPRGFILNDMGSGKTASALWAADYLMTNGYIRKAIVVCPKSISRTVWENAVKSLFLYRRTVAQLTGKPPTQRAALLNSTDYDFYIINHDGVKSTFDEIKARDDIDLFILDEAGDFVDPSTDRWKCMHDLTPREKWFWPMTATPTSRSPVSAWGLARLIRNGKASMSRGQFTQETMLQVSKYKWVPKVGSTDRAFELLQPAIRFSKDECNLDLPPCTFSYAEAELSTQQKFVIRSLKDTMVAISEEGAVVKSANAAVNAGKLMQAYAGVVYDRDREQVDLKPVDRINTTVDLVKQAQGNVIVYVGYTSVVDYVVKHLQKKLGKAAKVVSVDGRITGTKREKIFNDFENSKDGVQQVMVAHPKVAAHGLTLISADTTIWYTIPPSLDLFIQANERMNRPGQVRNMTIAMIVSTPAEKNVFTGLQAGKQLMDSLLDLYSSVPADGYLM